MNFRLLNADEIEARVSMVKKNGLSLLLYKDARCDMNILDETVGSTNWQRHHSRDNANCTVSIWDDKKEQWISKEDTGTESNTEKEKGLASDSFKRACFNWGIGRELYTAPFIWFPSNACRIEDSDGKYKCFDRFSVDRIEYNGRKICQVVITDLTTKSTISFGAPSEAVQKMETVAETTIGPTKARALEQMISEKGIEVQKIYERYGVRRLADLTESQHLSCIRCLEKTEKKK